MPPSNRRPHADTSGPPVGPTRYDRSTPAPFSARWGEGLDRRTETRLRRRMACEINVGGRRYSGLVVDLSSGGLFVRTRATLSPGTVVALQLRDGRQELPLQAAVARRRMVPARLASVSHGGVGLRLVHAPESYQRILSRLT